MAWEARSGLKRLKQVMIVVPTISVGMAWEARSGLKLILLLSFNLGVNGRNGLGSPFGIETGHCTPFNKLDNVGMAWEARSGLKPLLDYIRRLKD